MGRDYAADATQTMGDTKRDSAVGVFPDGDKHILHRTKHHRGRRRIYKFTLRVAKHLKLKTES